MLLSELLFRLTNFRPPISISAFGVWGNSVRSRAPSPAARRTAYRHLYEDAAHLCRVERTYAAEGFTVVPVRVTAADTPVQATPGNEADLDGAAQAERAAPAARAARIRSAAPLNGGAPRPRELGVRPLLAGDGNHAGLFRCQAAHRLPQVEVAIHDGTEPVALPLTQRGQRLVDDRGLVGHGLGGHRVVLDSARKRITLRIEPEDLVSPSW